MLKVEKIKSEIKKHIEKINGVKSDANSVLNWSNAQETLAYMNQTQKSSNFFSRTDEETLFKNYISEIKYIATTFCNEKYSDKEKLLNLLEYFRFTSMSDNLSISNNNYSYSDLSNSCGLNIALNNKGLCVSQSCFFRDILNFCNIEADTKSIILFKLPGSDKKTFEGHRVVYVYPNKDQTLYIDPTWYNGNISSIDLSRECAKFSASNFGQLNITNQDITKARQLVGKELIKKFGIDFISEKLDIANSDNVTKQMLILSFIEKNVVSTSQQLNFRTALLENREFEVGKLLELLYIANDIDYSIQESQYDRYATTYITSIDGKKAYITPMIAFDKNSNEKVVKENVFYTDVTDETKNTHYEYMWKDSKEKISTIINQSRKEVNNYLNKQNKSVLSEKESILQNLEAEEREISEIEKKVEQKENGSPSIEE